MAKYVLTDETHIVDGVTLHRVMYMGEYTEYHGSIKLNKFDLGGWIESTDNLSQEGYAWVHNTACVYGNARVVDNALVARHARVYGNAIVSGDSRIINHSHVFDHAQVSDSTINNGCVFGHSNVSNNCIISHRSCVHGNANISDNVVIKRSKVYDNANIFNRVDISRSNIFGNVTIGNDVNIDNEVNIYGDAVVTNDIRIDGRWNITDSAFIDNKVRLLSHTSKFTEGIVKDNVKIYNNVKVEHERHDDYSIMCDNSEIFDNVKLFGTIDIRKNAKVSSVDCRTHYERNYITIDDNVVIHGEDGLVHMEGKINLSDYAEITGNAYIRGIVNISGNSVISDKVYIHATANIRGNTKLYGTTKVTGIGLEIVDGYYDGASFISNSNNINMTNVIGKTSINRKQHVVFLENGILHVQKLDNTVAVKWEDCKFKQFMSEYFKIPVQYAEHITVDDAHRIFSHITDGMSINDFVDRLRRSTIVYIYKHGLHDLTLTPGFTVERDRGNNDNNTFDRIHVEFPILHKSGNRQEIKNIIDRKSKHFTNMIVLLLRDYINEKFGIPMNFLKITDAIFTKDYRMIYILELKNV